ncbi:MAG: GlsB/YeaQ/YmgE family stress response membrane protein [Prevotella sp.]|nr:GlsB/YeaQ/YmgE family stress response membrane protein [Prevotella sp.]
MEGFIGSIIVGCLAGFLAGKIMKGKGYGCLLNIVLGVIGGVIGGKALDVFGIEWGGLVGQIGTAVIGAVLILWIASLFKK